VLSEMWIGLRRNLTMTIAVIITVAISLALFGSGLLVQQQISHMRQFWDERVSVTVYMCTDVSPSKTCQENGAATNEDRESLQADLEALPEVSSVKYVTASEAWKDFQDRFSENQALTEAAQEGEDRKSTRLNSSHVKISYAVSCRNK